MRLGLVARGYLQDGASFWRRQQPDGAMPPALRTADRTLGPMASAQLEVIGERGLGAARVVAAIGGLGLWYLDAAAQSRRLALLVLEGFGVSIPASDTSREVDLRENLYSE